ncbi:hypothetical protein K523DRAFT_421584 [Schizophyllum commune Tattone D]|nr:hypothetical protein K523DRAFT_421584 [Schizophyllum commune Tattone D]
MDATVNKILDLKDRYSRDAPADGDVMDGYPLAYASRHPESPPKKRERAADVDDIMPDLVSHLAHLSPVQRATRPDAVTPDPKAHPPSNSHLSRALVVIVGKATDTRFLYKRRITSRYTSFTTLKSFLDVNYSGLRNILKKCDQATYGNLPACSLEHASPPWHPAHTLPILDALHRSPYSRPAPPWPFS